MQELGYDNNLEEPEIVIVQQEEEEHTINIGSIEQAHPEDTYTPIVATVDDPEINININDSDNTDEHQQNDEEDPSPNNVQESSIEEEMPTDDQDITLNKLKKCLNSEKFGQIISAINLRLAP